MLACWYRPLLLLFAPVALVSCTDHGPRDDVGEVRACYEAYMKALENGDGDAAAALVDRTTVDHFERMVAMAREADSSEVMRVPLVDRMIILGLRLHSDAGSLNAMDGREALRQAIENGGMVNEGIEGLGAGTITIHDKEAEAPLTIAGFPTPFQFRFRMENDHWRIDITSLFTFTQLAMGQLARSKGYTLEEFTAGLLMGSDQDPLPAHAWHPPVVGHH